MSNNGCSIYAKSENDLSCPGGRKGEAEPFVAGKQNMEEMKKLPESEFDVMREVWGADGAVNTAYLMEKVGKQKGWKAPTLISFLVRLEERGFVSSEKKGKERYYTPVVDQDDYLNAVTEDFVNRYHGGSFVALMDCLYRDKGLSGSDLDGMLEWLKTKY